MTSASANFPPPRITANLTHAWGGIWRLTLLRLRQPSHWLTLGGLVALLAMVCLGFLKPGNGPQYFLSWAAKFYFTFLVPVLAFITAAGVMREEMKAGTADYVLTRPVPRPAFLVFKFLAHTVCAQLDFLFSFGALLAVAAYRDVPDLAAAVPVLLFAQVLLVAAFSAFGFLCGALSARYVIIGIVYAGIVEIGVGQIPTQLSRLSMTHQVRAMLQPLVASSTSPFGVSLEALPAAGKLATLVVLLAFTALMLALAAAFFTMRELSGPADS
jgi:ABC-2 type transport system permease protein